MPDAPAASTAAPAAQTSSPSLGAPSSSPQPSLRDAIAQQGIPQAGTGKPLETQKPAEKKPAAQQQQQKPADKPADKPVVKGADRLPDLGAEPAESPEKTQQNAADDDDTPEKQKTWDKYRNGFKEYEKVKPEYEELKKKAETWTAREKELETIQQELAEARKFKAAFDWENGDEYKTQIAQPMAAQWDQVAEVAEYLGVDRNKLTEAIRERNTLRRDELIEAVLNESGKEVRPSAVTRVTAAASELHRLDSEGEKMREKALDLQNAIKGQKETETLRQKQEREVKWAEASTRMAELYEGKFKPLIEKNPELREALRQAKLAEDPMDQAFQAQSAEILPVMAKAFIEVRAENAALQKKLRAMTGAKPGLGGEQTQKPQNTEQQVSLREAAAAHFSLRQ